MNINEATAQEVFTHVAKHLLKQDEQAVINLSNDEEGPMTCAYRAPDGMQCAAGCLIGADQYKPEFEGKLWLSVAKILNLTKHSDLIRALQKIHDTTAPRLWRDELETVARFYALEMPTC